MEKMPHNENSPERTEMSDGLKEKMIKLLPKLKSVRKWAMAALLSTAAIEGGTALKEVADSGYFTKFPRTIGRETKIEKIAEKGLAVGMTELFTLCETTEDMMDILHKLGITDSKINRPEREVSYTVKDGDVISDYSAKVLKKAEYYIREHGLL